MVYGVVSMPSDFDANEMMECELGFCEIKRYAKR